MRPSVGPSYVPRIYQFVTCVSEQVLPIELLHIDLQNLFSQFLEFTVVQLPIGIGFGNVLSHGGQGRHPAVNTLNNLQGGLLGMGVG